MAPRPVFVTRKFPPSVGGMETLAESAWRSLSLSFPSDAHLVANGRSNLVLPAWIPWALARTAWLIAQGRADVVLAGDALMSATLAPLLRLMKTPLVTMVMGLDVTYPNRTYQSIVRPSLTRATRVVAISRATADAAAVAGVPRERISVIRLGVRLPERAPGDREAARREVDHRWGTQGRTIITTLGRLVPRKGVRWFVENVLDTLPANVVYLIGGDGPDRAEIELAASRGLQDRIRLLGRIDDAGREALLRGADAFVQPNIPVPGDLEGFGLVTLEATLRGTPVVASDLEGLQDSVMDGVTGWLVAPGDANAWRERLTSILEAEFPLKAVGQGFADAARDLYSEQAMGAAIAQLLDAERPSRGGP